MKSSTSPRSSVAIGKRAVAVFTNNLWIVHPEDKNDAGDTGVAGAELNAGSIIIKAAFILPTGNEYLISYPTLAGGSILLSGDRKQSVK
jgi:hypothetical protein